MKRKQILVGSLGVLAMAWPGCGGGGGGPTATNATGDVIHTASGSEVTVEAHNHWRAAIAMFETHEHEAQGWTPANCQATLQKFNEANAAQGGNFTEAIYMLGVVSGRCGNEEAALGHYRTALQTNPRYCGARVGVALADMRAGRTPAARTVFEQAIADDNQCTAAYVNLAIIQRENPREVEEALDNLRRALAIEADYLPAFNQMALLYYHQAQENAQRLDLAQVVCRQAQIINANYAPIYNTWGLVKLRQGNIIEALRLFERAIDLDDRFFEAYMNFAQITISFRGYQAASTAFARARELQPTNYDAVIGLGAAQRGLGQLDAAEATYRAAIAMDGQRPEAYFNLGLLYQDFKGGQIPALEQARQFYEQFTQRAANQPRYTDAHEGVTRTCRRIPERRRRRSGQSEWVGDCRPGRIQQIQLSITLMRELAEMQSSMQQGGGGGGGGN